MTHSFTTPWREAPISGFYQPCSRTIPAAATIQGARRASGRTNTRTASTKKKTDLSAKSAVFLP